MSRESRRALGPSHRPILYFVIADYVLKVIYLNFAPNLIWTCLFILGFHKIKITIPIKPDTDTNEMAQQSVEN